MEIDPARLAAAHGLRVRGVTVIADRPGRFVAKLSTDDGSVLIKAAAADLIDRELAGVARLAAAGLPVPVVVGHGVGPPPYVLLRWVDGTGLSADSPVAAQAHAGRLLRRVHELGGGPPYADTVPTWPEWMAGWLNHATAWWRDTGRADPSLVRGWWDYLDRYAARLATRGYDCMLFDGRPEHFIVSEQPRRNWSPIAALAGREAAIGDQLGEEGGRIAVMIDLSEVRAGDGAMDLAVMAVEDPDLLPGVLVGYRPSAAESAAFGELIPFYLALRRLARAQWYIDNGEPARADPILRRLAAGDPAPPS